MCKINYLYVIIKKGTANGTLVVKKAIWDIIKKSWYITYKRTLGEFMAFKKRIEKGVNVDYAFLKGTKLITQEDRECDPAWAELGQDYDDAKKEKSSWIIKATLTIINSIILQRRVVFIITRESLRRLLKTDQNWDKNLGLRQGNYRLILKVIYNTIGELVELVENNKTGRKVAIIKVTSKDLLKYLQANYEEQLEEAREVIRHESLKDRLKKTNEKKEQTPKKIQALDELKRLYPNIDPHLLAVLYVKIQNTKEFETIINTKKASSELDYSEDNKKEWEKKYQEAEKASRRLDKLINDAYKYFLNNQQIYLQMYEDYAKLK